MNKWFVCFLILSTISGCLGCSGERIKPAPKTYKVTGKVTYNGKPVSGATVSYWGPKSPVAGAGQTNDDGEYSLMTTAGENQVTVTKPLKTLTGPADSDAARSDPSKFIEATSKDTRPLPPAPQQTKKKGAANKKKDTEPPPPKPLIPVRYENVTSTPLTKTVSATEVNEFALELTD